MKDKPMVAFLGPQGTFTQEALFKYFGDDADSHSCSKIRDVFNSVIFKKTDYGIVPAENSVGGSISDTLDLFTQTDVKIYDQTSLKIKHNLLANCTKDKIKKIYSHPQVFLQCSEYINSNFKGIEIVETDSTSRAASIVKDEGNSAVIGNEILSKFYGIDIIERAVNDSGDNETKFFIISNEINPDLKSKSLILFSAKNSPGSLFKIIKIFNRKKINMTRIESRPSKINKWEYVFLIEYTNQSSREANEKLLKLIAEKTFFIKYLGSY